MLLLFRKIRSDLMEKNKTINYLKYAIGEIVLVVIGILIALQINNWNEDRKDQLRLKNHYLELLNELNNDKESLKDIVNWVREFNNRAFEISEFINSSQTKIDTAKIIAGLLNVEAYGFFSVSKSAYTTLLSSGDIQLIENTELKNTLSIYHDVTNWDWTAHNGNLKEVIELYSSYVHKFLPPLLFRDYYISIFSDYLKNETFNTYVPDNKPKIEWEKLKNDEKLKGIISQLLTYRVFQLKFYNEQLGNIDKMIDLLQTELK
jgi:hypothetical protein